jgi:hypothetical protein
MPVRLVLTGLEELKAQLRQLPAELTAEAGGLIAAQAQQTADDIRVVYNAHRHAGDLADHVTVTVFATGPYGTGARIKSMGKHAWIFEHGSQARHYITTRGHTHVTGRMPPTPTFIPAMTHGRRRMWEALAGLLERAGLRATGRGDE